jgi:hypothetical protein
MDKLEDATEKIYPTTFSQNCRKVSIPSLEAYKPYVASMEADL